MAKGGKWVSRYSKYWLFTLAAGIVAFLLLYWIMVQTVRVAKAAPSCDVRVSAPADLQARLNQAGQGKTVCLSGTFSGTVRPPQGQTIVGGKLHGGYDLHAGHVTLNGVEVYGSRVGVIMGSHATVTGSYIHDSYQNGISAYAGFEDWAIRITNNRLVNNGSKSLEGNSSAGMKLMALAKPTHPVGAGAIVTGNTVTGSHGNGIWLDQSASSALISNNTIHNSTRHGFRCEKCGGPVEITGNTISGSGYDGIDVTSSGVVTLRNNTVTDSHDWGVTIHEDWRAKKVYPNLGDVTMGWHLYRIVFANTNKVKGGIQGCDRKQVVCSS
jgi:parallel beta-helix repeat protein